MGARQFREDPLRCFDYASPLCAYRITQNGLATIRIVRRHLIIKEPDIAAASSRVLRHVLP